MKNVIFLFVLFCSTYSFCQEYHTVDNVIVKKKKYQVQAKFNDSDFNVKIATTEKHEESLAIAYDIDSTAFKTIILILINKLDTDLPDNQQIDPEDLNCLENVFPKLQKKKKALRSITEIIDGEPAQYSGSIKLNTIVTVTHDPSITKEQQCQIDKELEQLKILKDEKIELQKNKSDFENIKIKKIAENVTMIAELNTMIVELNTMIAESNTMIAEIETKITVIEKKIEKIEDDTKPIEKHLHINKAYINFFNNKASTIVLEGIASDNAESASGGIEFTSENKNFSIPIRYFNAGSSTNPIEIDGKIYSINYNDVFSYNADQHYNYSIANDELHFDKDNLEQQVRQRQFFDFFTAVLYTDVMAFDNNNSNSLVNAQAKILLPLNQRNSVKRGINYTFFRQLTAEANIALYNGSTDNLRTIQVTKDENPIKFNHFELLTKNNINGTLATEIFTHEAKRFFSHFALGYSASFYRTTLSTTTINSGEGEDAKESAPLYSIGHGPYLNVEIRPQTNFGADVSVSFNHLTYNGTDAISGLNIHETIENDGVQYFGFKYNIINIKADFYWLTKPEKGKKGGVFTRLGGYYHAGSHDFYPQLMVGYATNLTSFVNKFSPKEKDNK